MSEHTTNIQNDSLLDIKHESHITICTDENIFLYKSTELSSVAIIQTF